VFTLITAICGVAFGFGGLLLGILNYFRDRPKLVVTLQWDMAVTDNPIYDPKKSWGVVRVTNIGRRTVYLANVALKLPKTFKTAKGFEHSHLLLSESLGGKKLAEGDPPAGFVVNQDDLAKYSEVWQQVRAIAEDSVGKAYKSNKIAAPPSWAKPDHGRGMKFIMALV
jgi:hypothetical protein